MKEIFSKLYGNLVVLRNWPGQHRIPYLPEEELHALRDRRLREIVRYAAETVPYYQKFFRAEGIDPREIRSAGDLDRLPLIDKEMVRKDPTLFVSISRKGRKAIPFVTSGTTGAPLNIWHDLDSLLANIAFGEREREVESKMCGRPFGYRMVRIVIPDSMILKVDHLYQQKTFIPVRPERLILSVLDPIEEIVKAINRFRPHVIRSYGSFLETMFRILALRKTDMHLPKVLIYVSDSMTTEARSLIEKEFGVPVLSLYNAVEAFKIGFFCERRRGFHIHEDLCHVKVVNPTGQRVANEEKGEVVISNLINRGMVLLNYRLGDIASMSNERCPCGRTLPLLSELEGRAQDTLFLQDGRFINPMLIWGVIKKRPEVVRYQFIQHEPERFELKLVTVDREVYERILGQILADLKNLLGASAVIEAEYHEQINPQPGVKFRQVMSLCKQS